MNRLTKSVLGVIAILFILACQLPSCSKEVGFAPTVEEVISDNTAIIDEGVAIYKEYQVRSANHFLKINACKATLDGNREDAALYYAASNANMESWTGHFKEQEAEFNKQLALYNQAANDPSKLNLAELQKAGALPTDLDGGMKLYVNAVVQAPPPVIDSEITKIMMATRTECFQSIVFTGGKVNDTAGQYNFWHDSLKGKLVTEANDILNQVSERVGFDLPESLPYVTGGTATDEQLK